MASNVILASASPQRKTLLEGLGVSFTVVPSVIDEQSCVVRDPKKRAEELAILKANEVFDRYPKSIVIGCDTLVVAHGESLLEKPQDLHDAERMLHLLSGKTCVVHSGIAVFSPANSVKSGVSSSSVTFRSLSSKDIAWWMRSRLWEGRSGAFQIDGPGQLMISKIEGDFTGVVGLPVFLLGELLRDAGIAFTLFGP